LCTQAVFRRPSAAKIIVDYRSRSFQISVSAAWIFQSLSRPDSYAHVLFRWSIDQALCYQGRRRGRQAPNLRPIPLLSPPGWYSFVYFGAEEFLHRLLNVLRLYGRPSPIFPEFPFPLCILNSGTQGSPRDLLGFLICPCRTSLDVMGSSRLPAAVEDRPWRQRLPSSFFFFSFRFRCPPFTLALPLFEKAHFLPVPDATKPAPQFFFHVGNVPAVEFSGLSLRLQLPPGNFFFRPIDLPASARSLSPLAFLRAQPNFVPFAQPVGDYGWLIFFSFLMLPLAPCSSPVLDQRAQLRNLSRHLSPPPLTNPLFFGLNQLHVDASRQAHSRENDRFCLLLSERKDGSLLCRAVCFLEDSC